jgi:hypothetical protein
VLPLSALRHNSPRPPPETPLSPRLARFSPELLGDERLYCAPALRGLTGGRGFSSHFKENPVKSRVILLRDTWGAQVSYEDDVHVGRIRQDVSRKDKKVTFDIVT